VNEAITTELFVAKMSGDVAPWHRPWFSQEKQNFHSKKPYKGLNRFTLASDHEDFYLTFKQVGMLGGNVKKGAKARMVVFWKFWEKKDKDTGNIQSIPVLKFFNVFQLKDIEGIIPTVSEKEMRDPSLFLQGALIEHGGSTAEYSPNDDVIYLPEKSRFDCSDHYYQTAFREIAMRELFKQNLFTERNPKAELAAEIAGAAMCFASGITNLIPDSVAYIDQWISAIQGDRNLLSSASSKAEKVIKAFGI